MLYDAENSHILQQQAAAAAAAAAAKREKQYKQRHEQQHKSLSTVAEGADSSRQTSCPARLATYLQLLKLGTSSSPVCHITIVDDL
jgi:hypothetical protein